MVLAVPVLSFERGISKKHQSETCPSFPSCHLISIFYIFDMTCPLIGDPETLLSLSKRFPALNGDFVSFGPEGRGCPSAGRTQFPAHPPSSASLHAPPYTQYGCLLPLHIHCLRRQEGGGGRQGEDQRQQEVRQHLGGRLGTFPSLQASVSMRFNEPLSRRFRPAPPYSLRLMPYTQHPTRHDCLGWRDPGLRALPRWDRRLWFLQRDRREGGPTLRRR